MKKTWKPAAIVTVYQANAMTPKGRLAVVKWLRRQAEIVRFEPDKLSTRYTARFLSQGQDP